jgi:predicted dehydrogenase
MRTARAAVIGTGFIGPAHVEALRRIDGVEVRAVASNEPARGRELAERFGIPQVYARWEDAVADADIDVIHNCTPNNLHFAINRAVLLAGKHVVSEKPLTLTSAESGTLLRLARVSGKVHAVNYNYRFSPLVQHARALIAAGEIGEPHLVHGHYLQDWLLYPTDYNWRIEPAISGTSRAVADIGSHWFDLIQFITGRTITHVCAELLTLHRRRAKPAATATTFSRAGKKKDRPAQLVPIATEDAGIVMLRLDNGGRGVVTVSQVSPGRKNRAWFEIDGAEESLAWDQEDPNRLWIGHRNRANEVLIKDPSLLAEEARRYAHYPGGHPEGYPDGLKNLFQNVYAFIRSGRDPRKEAPDFPTFADGHRENLIVEAVLRSARAGRWVAVRRA